MPFNRILWFAIIVLLMTACSSNPAKTALPDQPNDRGDNDWSAQLEEIRNFQELAEEALVWRAKAIEFFQAHVAKQQQAGKKLALTHAELERLYDGARTYLDIRRRITETAQKHAWLANPRIQLLLSAQGETLAHDGHDPGASFPWQKPVVPIDVNSPEGRLLMLQLKTSLAAALILYDNYLVAIYPYAKDQKFRYLFNRDFESYLKNRANKYTERNTLDRLEYHIGTLVHITGALDDVTNSYLKDAQRDMIVTAIDILDRYEQLQHALPDYRVTEEEAYLDLLWRQSPTYNYIRRRGTFKAGGGKIIEPIVEAQDNIEFFKNAFSFIVSEGLGNGMGLIAFREGKLLHLAPEEKQAISGVLQPLDILLEKTPFRLTDKFIPGHWGHVALWLGRYDEIKNLGIAEHPLVKKYEKQFGSNRLIVEALRSGVEMNTFEHFLNIDDLLVLRPRNLSLAEKREYLIRALEQVGKEYDFNFNVETDERIVCSELAYVVFHHVQWPTDKQLGRYTISPDHVAKKALDGTFEPVLIYHEGEKVNGNLNRTLDAVVNNKPITN
jgi:hypothetical protein